MSTRTSNLIEIHLAALLLGFVAIIIKLIHAPLITIAFGRSLFAIAILVIFVLIAKETIRLETRRDVFYMVVLGVFQALQWLAFFKSIKVSTVAIALLSLFTFPAIVALIEPIFFREKFRVSALIAALMILVGIGLVVPEFSLDNSSVQGVLWGLASAVLMAFPFMIQRKYIQKYSSLTISLYRTIFTAIVLAPFVVYSGSQLSGSADIGWIALLGTVFTAIPHFLFIKSLQTLKAQQSSAIVSLEIPYGIVFAMLLLGEIPVLRTVAGAAVILGVTLYLTFEARKEGEV